MFQENLKAVRNSLGLSQAAIAKKLNIQQTQYSTYERGDRKPSCEVLEKLAFIFNINVNYLLTSQGPMFVSPEMASNIVKVKMPKDAALLIEHEV